MANVDMAPSDILGALQRNLTELHAYLGQPLMQISLEAVGAHMDLAETLVSILEDMQRSIIEQSQAAAAE